MIGPIRIIPSIYNKEVPVSNPSSDGLASGPRRSVLAVSIFKDRGLVLLYLLSVAATTTICSYKLFVFDKRGPHRPTEKENRKAI